MSDNTDNRQGAKSAKILKEPRESLDELAHGVIGAAIEVHRHLGPGFPENVYEEALACELNLRGIAFARQPAVDVFYKGRAVGHGRPDFVVGGHLVVEIKAVTATAAVHQAQVISYLKAIGSELGLLLNFREVTMQMGIKRVVLSALQKSHRPSTASELNEAHQACGGLVVPCRNESVPL